ncbi:hypothetical protein MYCTH_2296944 [Thermothelomyces thermophilus ATCC 42464]|uniref:AMP deaminase n=1 Tax=Thermothelomyces thermophilus (strain ATCC 42464 / BCRC 31852 / DSM 1799) TaxID=573729 RepID=G2Q3Q0_THET4|nr:uncharacterized protein MYCTH_2296944 [Thermothelomyces thermophilus ATCC 42464]AEO54403.1 hypothetical protein MYCTH_2296944 [Thermothelomyces thermophilus ATCC 42464]
MPELDSDNEEYRIRDQGDTGSEGELDGHDSHGSDEGHIEAGSGRDDGRGRHQLEMEDGMLPRDMPPKTAFYDMVTERQMTQTDAKLFYQRSQAESRTQLNQLSQMSPQGSPLLAAGGLASPSPDLSSNLGRSFSNLKLSDIGSAPTPESVPDHSLRKETGFIGAANAASLGSHAQLNSAGPVAGTPIDAALHQQMLLGGGVPGLGNSSYLDADPQINAELSTIFKDIKKILDLRNKYIRLSLQGPFDNPKDDPSWNIYPPPPEPAWTEDREKAARGGNSASNSMQNSLVLNVDKQRPDEQASDQGGGAARKSKAKKRKPGQDIGEDFDLEDLLPVPGPCEMTFRMDDMGVYQVYENQQSEEADTPFVKVPTIKEYYLDLEDVLNISSDGPSKSFAFRRLQYLEGKFNLYILLNEYQETADSKKVPHRDFYNVRKVDTHVHHSACMNQKHLLRFIKSKMKKFPDEIVLFRDGKHLTLAEVFESINLTAYDLSIDTLDMHAHKDSFHRFDKFNLKYNPIGESRLRTIFLKTDNFIKGRYLAEITKEVIADLESSKYQMVEWRISIYGKALDEWDKLAAWVVDNKIFSHNVRWLIQIPRLYDVYKGSGLMDTFEQIIKNIFQPLFEVTKDPSSHPKLHIFLQRVIGIDSVDDESKVERRLFKKFPVPRVWDSKQNPPYTYWIYYLYANLVSLNHFRKQRGFNTFVLRPHCGEAGDSEHLAVAALCCHSISHGLLLRKVPLLQYVFYLEQIGIAMSPLSNNALFLAYERNPFIQYFKRGLNVSLSTDDPLQFAFTKEPLIEEYAVAAQIYKLSSVDMCELAKNSVKQSGYEFSIKQQWLGPNFHLPGRSGNTQVKTNVPDRREEFRYQTLMEERRLLERYTSAPGGTPSVAGDPITSTGLPPRSPAPTTQAHATASTAGPISDPRQQQQTAPLTTRNALEGQAGGIGSPALTGIPMSLSQTQLSAAGSPLTLAPSSGLGTPAAGVAAVADPTLHSLSGHEPRYFPGMVSRSQKKGSTRRESGHESDVVRGDGEKGANGGRD